MNLNEVKTLYEQNNLIGQFDLSHDTYFAAPGINSSFLVDWIEYSPAHAKEWKENPPEASKAMEMGTLIHMAILEPGKLDSKYRVVQSTDKRTKEGKAVWEQAEKEGFTPVSTETMDKVKRIRDSLFSTNTGRALFSHVSHGMAEQSFFGRDPETDLLLKCKADFVNPKLKILIDLKKTSDGRLWHIKKSIRDYGYLLQSAYYPDVINLSQGAVCIDAALWVFIEETAPFGIRFIEVSKTMRQQGFDLYRKALTQYSEAMKTGIFQGYDDQIICLEETEGVLP